jgi:signal transduction histidine kinase
MATNALLCDGPDEVARLQYQLLRDAPDLVVEVATDTFRAVEIAARTRPDIVVANVDLDAVGGPEMVRRMRAAAPSSKVIVRSDVTDPAVIAASLAAGAAAYLVRADGLEGLTTAIRSVQEGGLVLSAGAAELLADEIGRTVLRVRDLEDELTALRDDVSQGTTAKADFLANISHELRTPVTVAKGIAYVLRNPSVPDAEREQFLEQLQDSLDKLVGIVDEIITLAELERGTFSLDLAPTDLGPLIRNAVDDVTRRYPRTPIEAQVPDALVAIADGGRIAGVVHELLDNACRYSPVGASVELVTRLLDEGVVVAVTDRGDGLDRGVAAQAFSQPFSTGEATLRKEKAGVGVGLHLARQIVVEHGGIMWADPLPGGGTRVSFCIPSHEGDRLQAPPAGAA